MSEVKLTVCRGVAGTGKSTYAKTLDCLLVEADMYFIRNSEYHFNREDHAYAKFWRNRVAAEAIATRVDCCVTGQFIMLSEVDDLIKSCLHKVRGRFNFSVEVIDFATRYTGKHDVPEGILLSNIELFEVAHLEHFKASFPEIAFTLRSEGPTVQTYTAGHARLLASQGYDVAIVDDNRIIVGETAIEKCMKLVRNYASAGAVDTDSTLLSVMGSDNLEFFKDELFDVLWGHYNSTELAEKVNVDDTTTVGMLIKEVEALRHSVNT